MKLVADVDTINANVEPLSTAVQDFGTAVSTFTGTDIGCPLDEIKDVLNSYKETIGGELEKLNTSSQQYVDLVDDCCSQYLDNESNTQAIDVGSIEEIISGNTDITSGYDMSNAKAKIKTIQVADFGPALKDTGNAAVDSVYNYLAKKGLNEAAICGILANIEHESSFKLDIVGDNGTSYGLCQWHAGRRSSLYSYCEANGYDPSSLEGQMEYMFHELETGYTGLYDKIQNVENTAQGASQIAYDWTVEFEKPADTYGQASSRASSCVNNYWPVYGKNNDEKKET